MSYAHADEEIATRLHQALETYKIPRTLPSMSNAKLHPIFRDATELSAHHSLSEKIQEAVNNSQFLIVLCSPSAKLSHWVNEEIRLFRSLHGESKILCVLTEGTPETSFPAALTHGGREPLAANIGTSKDSFRLGTTQLAASILGVGLDTLIQRNIRRRRRRLQGMTASAMAFSAFMAAITYSAVQARTAAENNRMQAEGLVEYMITDLKAKLEPVGRLDILDSVGERAVQYYDAQDIEKLTDDSLARQARARHILGQVALDAGDYKDARTHIEGAARITKEVYDRNPSDTEAIFAHAQSEYWLGLVYYYEKNYPPILPHWEAYAALGNALFLKDPNNPDWAMEQGWGKNNLAQIHLKLRNPESSEQYYLGAVHAFEAAAKLSPDNTSIHDELANTLSGLAQLSGGRGDKKQALDYRNQQIAVYDERLRQDPRNYPIRYRRVQAQSRLLTEGLLDANPDIFIETLKQTHNEYAVLLNHDRDNEMWKKDYISFLKELYKHVENRNFDFIDPNVIASRIKDLEIQ